MNMRYYLLISLALIYSGCGIAQKPNPKAANYFNQAYVEYQRGNDKNSLALLKKALKADPKHANSWSLQAEIADAKGDTALATRSHRGAQAAAPNYQPFYYFHAKYLFKQKRFAEAIAVLEAFDKVSSLPGFNPKKDAAAEGIVKNAGKLRESCKLAMEDNQLMADLDIRNLGSGVNTSLSEYWPGMSVDGNTLIFTRRVDNQEDFYISNLAADSSWSSSSSLPGKINTPENEGTTAVSADGRFIFFSVCNQDGFGSCDIFYSYLSGARWSQRYNCGEVVNSRSWDAQPTISADGRTLIFSSARPGGFGGKDLWQSKYIDGSWTKPENLGSTINTDGDDGAPFLHYDGKTLYFASDGHPGYGEQDIFFSRLQPDGTWSKPENLGKGINSESDEMGLYVDFKGDKAYFASDRKGGYGGLDLYSFRLGKGKKPTQVTYVRGQVFDAETGAELSGRIELVDLESNKLYYRDSSSYFFTTMTPNGNYAFNVSRQGYLFYSANFQPLPGSVDSPFVVKAMLKPVKADQTIVLRNIFFDTDKFDIKSESHSELDQVVKLMRQNPTMKIEISGHTDNQGSADHNQKLSKNRAKAVSDYLVSAGIPANRLTTQGFGADKPVADNSSVSGRALNRRIEMKVTSL
jgi:outer membrane protein OmpA-like peptidoglycan-associated protein